MKELIEVKVGVDLLSVFSDPNLVLIRYAMKCVDKFIEFRLYGEDEHQYINDPLKCLVTVCYNPKSGVIMATVESIKK